MGTRWRTASVIELQREGVLLVEDGNHGEFRPRPNEFTGAGVAFIRAADMSDGRVLFDSASKINDDARRRITKGIGAGGDVLLSHKGTVGKVSLVPLDAPPFVCSPQTTFWRTLNNELLDREYLHAFLRSPGFHRQLAERSGETDMAPYVSLTSQRGLMVSLPPVGEQRAIARIVGGLDKRIGLNIKMNQTLEAMAQALFKSWFVDFDPVRAKAEGRQPEGMDAETAALFPLEFDHGTEWPAGWRRSTVGQEFDVTMGQSPPGETYNEAGEGTPFFQGRADFGFRFPTNRVYCTAPTRMADAGATLVSVRAPVGDINVALERCAVGRGVAAVRGPNPTFALYSMWSLRSRFEAFESEGTVFGAINKADFHALPVIGPPQQVIDRFEDVCSPLDARIRANELESRTLTALRDVLLPRLLSGEIRLGDAEASVAKAV